MNDTETHSPARDFDFEGQVAALQRQVFLLLLALIVVTATVVFYLYFQSRFSGADLNRVRPEAMQVINVYNQHALAIENFDKQLAAFGAKNRDFQPILIKDKLLLPAATPKQ